MTETTAKPKPNKTKKYMLVRHGRMRSIGLFEHEEAHIPKTPTQVVVKTDKGLELGRVVGEVGSYKEGRFRFTEEQICGYYTNSDINFSGEPQGKFIRYATADDISEQQHLTKITSEEIACCERLAKELKLKMKIVGAEHIFGGERIIFYFMSEGRVDFRDLVRRLAQEYQTRIEMRQIGSRDEAKLLGDVESCGQECCCIKFLQLLKPVNMRMAKMQKATLDPSKISGYCGRLKCCLRYEDENYMALKKRLPKRNTWVRTKEGEGKVIEGKVINGQILTQLVMVETEKGERVALPVDELTILPGPPAKPDKPKEGEGNASSRSPRQSRSSRSSRPPRSSRSSGSSGKSDASGKPDSSGKSDTSGKSDAPGKPDPSGKSDSSGSSGSSRPRRSGRRPRRGGRGKKPQ